MALNVALQLYRGPRADLAVLASSGKAGVLAWTTDTNELFVDTGSGTGIPAAWSKVAQELIGVNAQSGVTYTFLTSDLDQLVTFTNASPVAVTLPQATAETGGFPSGWQVFISNQAGGAVTITPTTSTIDGVASIVLQQYEGLQIVSDGTNYFTVRGTTSVPAGETFVQYAAGPTANEWVTYIDSNGVQHYAQPSFSNISGTLSQTQLPASIGAGSNLTSIDLGTF